MESDLRKVGRFTCRNPYSVPPVGVTNRAAAGSGEHESVAGAKIQMLFAYVLGKQIDERGREGNGSARRT